MLIKDFIKSERKARKLSIRELSEISGIAISELYCLEKKDVIARPLTIKKLAKAFNYDYEKLFDTFEEENRRRKYNGNKKVK